MGLNGFHAKFPSQVGFVPRVIKDDEEIAIGEVKKAKPADGRTLVPLSRFQMAMAKNMSVQVFFFLGRGRF